MASSAMLSNKMSAVNGSHRAFNEARPRSCPRPGVKRVARPSVYVRASADPESRPAFGYTRKDAIIIGVVLVGGGIGLKAGLTAAGVDDIMAGVYSQLAVVLFLCFGWVGSYIFRVATKQMTYAQQLQQYEAAVMKKRLEEMTDDEVKALSEEMEREKQG